MIELIAFDADDTLWHNAVLYRDARSQFTQIMAPYCDADLAETTMYKAEIDNLVYYGYGIKSFILSMIEAAIELSGGRITGPEIQQIIEIAKRMSSTRLRLVDHAKEVVAELAETYPLIVVTRGDLFDQEAKIQRSGLKPYFQAVEVVSDKTRDHYAALLAKYHVAPPQFLMVGNSLRADICPVVALGGKAVLIPHPLTWAHENDLPPDSKPEGYYEVEHIGLLPGLIEQIRSSSAPGLYNRIPGGETE
jgi:putative hydrolase of the HAD superfamily